MRLKIVVLFCLVIPIISFQKNKKYKIKSSSHFPEMPVNKNNIPTTEGVKLGRHLFYDPILSNDSNMACATCHQQQFAFADGNIQFSNGYLGEKLTRNTRPLFNLAWYPTLFWDGSAAGIEQQIFHPILNKKEMHGNVQVLIKKLNRHAFYKKQFKKAFNTNTIDSTQVVNAIAQFLRTLVSTDSKFEQALRKETKLSTDEIDGLFLFNDQSKADCLQCHSMDDDLLGTRLQIVNNGLDTDTTLQKNADKGLANITKNTKDFGKFITPSLRNIALTAPYMHDGRFKTLEEVLDFYSEHLQASKTIDPRMQNVNKGGSHLTEIEKRKIITFLHTLTDSSFIKNKNFGNPFLQK